MSREVFLDRVRQAAQAGRAHRVTLHPVPADVGYVGVQGDLCARFAAEVEAVGGRPQIVPDLAAARQALSELLADAMAPSSAARDPADPAVQGPAAALCWQHQLLSRLGLAELLSSRGITLLDYVALADMSFDARREAMLHCQIGITSCDWAIAETGSLVMCSRPGRERVASLLPPVHVAVVQRQQIVPDLIDAVALLGGTATGGDRSRHAPAAALPSNVVLITGPSKTGDIELQLTTGVHGPGRWHVIIIDGEPS